MEALVKMFSLAGKTAVVTGGTRGIGAAMAIALAQAGADIILIQVGQSSREKATIGERERRVARKTDDEIPQ